VLVRLTISIHLACGAEHLGHDGRMGAGFAIVWARPTLRIRFTRMVRFGVIPSSPCENRTVSAVDLATMARVVMRI
jgi:hypothetical protein